MYAQFQFRLLSLIFFGGVTLFATGPLEDWPLPRAEHRPWTRWWWHGSAVDEAGLTRELEVFARAGLGGVEVTPIFGVRGEEAREVAFLSPRWVALLAHAAREAKRLGLGLDMATGTGWPFGGPWVEPAQAAKRVHWRAGQLAGEATGMWVKRAAPGGEGLVLDPYDSEALERYLAPFGTALEKVPKGLIRCQFHDSFEYYGADWTERLPAQFERQHGYALRERALELMGLSPCAPEVLARLKGDYRATLAGLHLDFIQRWATWSRARGFRVRNQSHGAPANLLDLYAAVDIPETEIYSSTPFPIPGLRREASDLRTDQEVPESLVLRLASSAAHVAGRRLVSSETLTWLREHWKEAPSMMKPEIDRVFTEGVNHIFFHGTPYSPPEVAWPGWLFYASTEYHPRNPLWEDLAELNTYITRVQSVLQAGAPDNDLLLYWPVHDLWDEAEGLMQQFTVHQVAWLTGTPCGALARQLLSDGYAFDYVSDAQLTLARVEARGRVKMPGASYAALVVPTVRRLPLETLETLLELARSGVLLVFQSWPQDVPGLGRLEERRRRFVWTLDQLKRTPGVVLASRPTPGALVSEPRLRAAACVETLAKKGLAYTRRRREGGGTDYFLANLGAEPKAGWFVLGVEARTATLFNPLDGRRGKAAVRSQEGQTQIYLQLEPGESLLLRTAIVGAGASTAWVYRAPSQGGVIELDRDWDLRFIRGGPELPKPRKLERLGSWTELEEVETQRFAGTACYRHTFAWPGAGDWWLELGEVRETARIRLNGQELGMVWSLPSRLGIPAKALRAGNNHLEIEVTNLGANRIRDLDRRGVDWKRMKEINYVDLHYRPFDAADWPLLPSGLLGPVRLRPAPSVDPLF